MSSRWDADDGEHVRRRGVHVKGLREADVHARLTHPVRVVVAADAAVVVAADAAAGVRTVRVVVADVDASAGVRRVGVRVGVSGQAGLWMWMWMWTWTWTWT